MKNYVQYFETRTSKWDDDSMSFIDVPSYPHEGMGSDSVFILDGRNSLANMIYDAKVQMKRLSNVADFTGFEIRAGQIRDNNPTILHSSF